MNTDSIVVVGAARTPMGGFQGELKDATAPQLGATAIRGALRDAGLAAEHVDEVLMGCVLPAGQGQAPARQASLAAGIPKATGCTTVNKMCGSGMKTAMLACDSIAAGSNRAVVAGGMESMSNAPYLLGKARAGLRMGHAQMLDHMFVDGLEDAYDKGRLMGTYAEDCAQHYQFTRDAQDAFAVQSLTRAQHAIDSGAFAAEVAPVTIATRRSEHTVERDEQPHKAKFDKIPQLKPAFRESGTVTAANSSSISDGAAALVLMHESTAEQHGATPIARIVGHASYADEPGWFTTAPIYAIRQLLEKLDWQTGDVDLYEINEAFAVVTMAAMRDLNLPHDNVNINGGACALGHPIGASGTRIIVTLLNALRQRQAKRGVAALCIGGGEATAMGFELIG
ncbi:MAG: acetyl-CoA C-acyltransferase [Gammaproteobacteria bacterium]|nr:acetyl-CoA C-acyltransferase [Gammaproteobacteria bacterium]MDH3466114.1 acetyl-CoA C-acyltransferase [Gammaproteobacteria bacterium]